MEKPILQSCCGSSSVPKGNSTLAPNPSTWHSLADLCQDVSNCLNTTGPCGKRLIVHFFLPGTQIRIDIGNVKAAGVLCVLGISFGIGTYVLYKIYDKFIRPSCRRRKPSTGESDSEEEIEDEYCQVKTDEGIMGNEQSSLVDIPVYYKPGYGVSLYKPPENQALRNRKFGPKIADLAEPIVKGNLQKKNGIKEATSSSDGRQNASENRVPKLSELRIEVDESSFVDEDVINNETSGDKLSNSLKGNFSPTSLYEKNRRFSNSELETDGEQVTNIGSKAAIATDADVYKDRVDITGAPSQLDHLKLDSKLSVSSVLLTPPSEDEATSSSNPQFFSGSAQYSYHSTKSDVSDIKSEVADPYTVETDEEREQMSPLPFDRSPHMTPERKFKKKLMLKLGEISSRGLNYSLGSNNSSSSTTPDSYLGHRRNGSLGGDKENSISGVSSPELELLNSENTDNPVVVYANTFNNIEQEIHGVEDEFDDISKKLQELSSKYSNQDTEPGSEIFKDIFQRYPSIRVRQQERAVHQRLPSLSEGDSVHDSRNTTSSDMDDVDLSWDLENVLDMVYSEASESGSVHNNPGRDEKQKQVVATNETELDENPLPDPSANMSNSFNSTVEINGCLYNEDDFHLQLGTAGLPNVPETKQEKECVTPPMTATVCNVGMKEDIVQYADREWKGDTPRAEVMRKAYRDIPNHCQYCHVRRIRGDNYCGIRGAVHQTLVNVIPPHHFWSSKDAALSQLSTAFKNSSWGMRQWTFANRITHTAEDRLDVMSRCVATLYSKFEELKEFSHHSDREQFVEQLLNSDPIRDLELMEGVKLLMLLSAINLYNDIQQGNEVPVFAWLMFARDTSEDIPSFVKNHLNPVGDSSGLEQVEMFLLGYSLGVRIQVFRLQQYGQEDFISHYPDDCKEDWPTISLIAEDDRHYNVPVL